MLFDDTKSNKMNQDIQAKIEQFWNWFTENEHRFRKVTDVREAVEAMDDQILEFGLFKWEIGPGINKPFYLTLSPNGNEERLELSKMIMDLSPDLRQWEFNYCKPLGDHEDKGEVLESTFLQVYKNTVGTPETLTISTLLRVTRAIPVAFIEDLVKFRLSATITRYPTMVVT